MSDEDRPLTDEERAELEELRAERERQRQAEQDRRDREELERLRAEREARQNPAQGQGAAGTERRTRRVRTVTPEEAAQIEHDRQVRERNAKLMEPGDDLSMPVGQKVALVAIFAFAIIAVLAIVFGPK